MTPEEILVWLSTILTVLDYDFAAPVSNRKKRQGIDSRMPSPPLSPMDIEAEASQQHKRVRTSGMDDHDIDAGSDVLQTSLTQEQHLVTAPNLVTPFTVPMATASAPDASGLERDSSDQASITGGSLTDGGELGSSARKRSRSLALQDDGTVPRSLIEPGGGMPLDLRKFLREIEYCGNGFAVISNTHRQEVESIIMLQGTTEVTRSQSTYRALGHRMWYPTTAKQQHRREALGPTPFVHDVLSVLEWAARCTSQAAEEPMWNAMVHVPILQLALYGGRGIPERQIDGAAVTVELTQCTTARLIQDYLPAMENPGKQVDFCFHLNVDPMAQRAIDDLRASLPAASINHFDMKGLLNRPIAASCESEKLDSDGGATEAKLQIGTWHAAQWKLLKHLIARQSGQHAHQATLPAFLPAIIIAGHDWSFAATTQRHDETVGGPPLNAKQLVKTLLTLHALWQVLWAEYPFGHTRDAAGVYKIVCGLQMLSAWARDEYWPWYRRCVLGLNDDQVDMQSEGLGSESEH
ncbi:hypothetical protein VP1G_09130 [Cytospora mali]|uniref:PD-(D/E)XK nuclease-like domain-containing protein n=1 Tax=Cytospora mali TaxID=578113 RepID=A0A194VDC4_CYTMA|nr:hypothetical protein VP1G_09130 [Valsa mali var. pyri (nom. inval.)]